MVCVTAAKGFPSDWNFKKRARPLWFRLWFRPAAGVVHVHRFFLRRGPRLQVMGSLWFLLSPGSVLWKGYGFCVLPDPGSGKPMVFVIP